MKKTNAYQIKTCPKCRTAPKAEGHDYCLECKAKVNHRWYTRHIREKRAYNKGYLAGRRSAAASAPTQTVFRIIMLED